MEVRAFGTILTALLLAPAINCQPHLRKQSIRN